MSLYEKHAPALVAMQQGFLALEVAYAHRKNETTLSVETAALEMLGNLLDDMAEILWFAPGGHQFEHDEARRWAAILKGSSK